MDRFACESARTDGGTPLTPELIHEQIESVAGSTQLTVDQIIESKVIRYFDADETVEHVVDVPGRSTEHTTRYNLRICAPYGTDERYSDDGYLVCSDRRLYYLASSDYAPGGVAIEYEQIETVDCLLDVGTDRRPVELLVATPAYTFVISFPPRYSPLRETVALINSKLSQVE